MPYYLIKNKELNNLKKIKPRYEYYGFRIVIITFSIIEIISLILFFSGYFLDIFIFFIFGLLGLMFGFYILISNLTVTLLLSSNTKTNQKLINDMINSLKIKGDEIVLDSGCGRGFFSNLIAKKLDKGKVFGIDIEDKIISSKDVLKIATENAAIEGVSDKTEFIKADVLSLPFKKNTFDIVVCISVLEYLDWKKECGIALKEIKRVLKPNGTLLLFEMIKSFRGFFIYNPFFCYKLKTKKQWRNIVIKEGFIELQSFEDKGRVAFIYKNDKSIN